MDKKIVEDKIADFLGLAKFNPEIDYLAEGILDSFGLIQLILYIEEEFGVRLNPEDTESYEFRTLGGLVDIVCKKLCDTQSKT